MSWKSVDAVPLRLDFSTGAWIGRQSAESGALKMELLPGFVRNFAPVRLLRWTAATQFMAKLEAWLMPNRALPIEHCGSLIISHDFSRLAEHRKDQQHFPARSEIGGLSNLATRVQKMVASAIQVLFRDNRL
jgi:hypothetical protein